MTWPTVAVDTTNVDGSTDSPASARADLYDALQKLNQIIAHVSVFSATYLDDADGAAVRATIGAQASHAELTALAALGASTGLAAHTAASTWALRALTGTANQVTVTNGNGVSGNPTISLPSGIVLPGGLTMGDILDLGATGKIKFPASASPSADANTLDDYEEGTWTPSVGGTATYNFQIGTYTKIGRQVTVHANLGIATIGTGSSTTISGLPFTSAASMYSFGPVAIEAAGISCVENKARIDPLVTSVLMVGKESASTYDVTLTSLIGSGTAIRFTATYYI